MIILVTILSALVGIAGILLYLIGETTIAVPCIAFGFLIILGICIWMLVNGAHNWAMIEDFRISEQQLKQRHQIEQLYQNTSHTDEWMNGFAHASSFFIRNYLSNDTIGPTEHEYWEAFFGKCQTNDIAEGYRQFMLLSLFKGYDISEEEFDKIVSMMPADDAKTAMADMFYSELMQSITEKDCQQFIEMMQNKNEN